MGKEKNHSVSHGEQAKNELILEEQDVETELMAEVPELELQHFSHVAREVCAYSVSEATIIVFYR